LNIATVTH